MINGCPVPVINRQTLNIKVASNTFYTRPLIGTLEAMMKTAMRTSENNSFSQQNTGSACALYTFVHFYVPH